jgi:hypothetical protein
VIQNDVHASDALEAIRLSTTKLAQKEICETEIEPTGKLVSRHWWFTALFPVFLANEPTVTVLIVNSGLSGTHC